MKKAWVIHPFFFSLFPILALYAHNVRSLPIPFVEVAGPLAVSVAGAGLAFLILQAALKDASRSGLLVSLLLLWFYSYGHIAGRITAWTGGIFNRSFFFATVLIVALIGFFIVRSRRTFAASLQDPQRRLSDSRRHQPCFGRADPGPPAAGRHT